MLEMGGSDLHVTNNSPPQIRVSTASCGRSTCRRSRRLRPSSSPTACSPTTRSTASRRTSSSTSRSASRTSPASAPTCSCSAGAVAAVYRTIPYEIKGFKELGLPPVVSQICEKPRGLVLVTGPTGSGKSTTLAAMLDKINKERHEHIITIEDPIEYLHNHQEVSRQSARGPLRHSQLHQRAASRAARGPRRRAHR